MNSLVSIDPAKRSVGWASFEDGELVNCGLVRADRLLRLCSELERLLGNERPDLAIVEIPQVYVQRKQRGDPNDLVHVAIVAGVVIHLLRHSEEVKLVRPRTWKGTRPKAVCNDLTLSRLNDTERSILDGVDVPASLRHNVIDAVGLGLWELKRR
jgi:hypothetical protein